MEESRRSFIKKSSIIALAGIGTSIIPDQFLFGNTPAENFTLPPLPYDYAALEPHIDKMTMEIHYSKHHKAYVDNLNKAVTENNISGTLDEIVRNISKYPASVRNNGGGHWNHSFFWKIMKPSGGGNPTGKINEAITSAFGSFDEFKSKLEEAGLKRFGSGWAWLYMDGGKKLSIGSTPNQDNPLMDISEIKGKPILGVDVWEHAYYLKYQNKRGDYLKSWWNTINWDEVNSNLAAAEK
jgi:Fe-Mn family superoxide dismutase